MVYLRRAPAPRYFPDDRFLAYPDRWSWSPVSSTLRLVSCHARFLRTAEGANSSDRYHLCPGVARVVLGSTESGLSSGTWTIVPVCGSRRARNRNRIWAVAVSPQSDLVAWAAEKYFGVLGLAQAKQSLSNILMSSRSIRSGLG